MKSWKRMFLAVIVLLTVLSLVLSACEPIDRSHGTSNPAAEKNKNKNKDKAGEQDEGSTSVTKITICHRTGSAKHPYVEITVADDAIKDGHAQHTGDIIPAPADGCPAQAQTPNDNGDDQDDEQGGTTTKITICHRTGSAKHPYVQITVADDAVKDGHAQHAGDIIPAPAEGCPSQGIATRAR